MNSHVSKEQLYEFAKYVKNHPAFGHIKELTQQDLFSRFVIGDDNTRAEVSDIMKGLLVWESTLNQIINKHISDDQPNN